MGAGFKRRLPLRRMIMRGVFQLSLLAIALLQSETATGQGAVDFTFFVWGDPHVGAYNADNYRVDCVEDMNRLPGTRYPYMLTGHVSVPDFVLVPGDITEAGLPSQWSNTTPLINDDYLSLLGILNYPTYELAGNHDYVNKATFVQERVAEKFGAPYYSFEHKGIHFIGLDTVACCPVYSAAQLAWLRADLASVGTTRPIIVFQHFNLTSGPEYNPLRDALAGYNVILLINGHAHTPFKYKWNNIDCFGVGYNKYINAGNRGFGVVHVMGNRLQAAHYDWYANAWYLIYTIDKPIGGFEFPTPTPSPTEPPPSTPTPTFTPAPSVRFQPELLILHHPPAGAVLPNATGEVKVEITAASDHGGHLFEIVRDATAAIVAASSHVRAGNFASLTGNSILSMPAVINEASWTVLQEVSVEGTARGPDGAGTLAHIIWTTKPVDHVTTVNVAFRRIEIRDAAGGSVALTEQGVGKVRVCFYADIDCDDDVDVVDVQMVAGRWSLSAGDPLYGPAWDVDGDGDIDIVDVQLVSSRWDQTAPF